MTRELGEEHEGIDEESIEMGEEEPSKEDITPIINEAKNGKTSAKDGMGVELLKYGRTKGTHLPPG